MSTGAQYVVAAYGVVLFALLMYAVAIGLKAARMAREAELLALLVERGEGAGDPVSLSQSDPVDAPRPAPRA